MSLRTCIAAAALCALSPQALAFPMFSAPPADTVVEYFNTGTGHYFYTWSPSDQEALQSGAFGTGWVRTGQGFGAYGTRERAFQPGYALDGCPGRVGCLPVTRFYAPGPNSHFFTALSTDIAILDRPGSGWFRENVAFYTTLPDFNGTCFTGPPVWRLYNNRAAQNDSNHRYTADERARALMVAQGWVEEGVAFCSYGKRSVASESHTFSITEAADVMDIHDCRARADIGSCLGMGNLPIPSNAFTSTSIGAERDDFDRQTGMNPTAHPVTLAVSGGSRIDAARDAFVQIPRTTPQVGIHLATQSRIGSPYSSISALRRLAPGSVRPYRPETDTDRQLYLWTSLYVQEASAAAGSHAYGVFTLQFRDEASGRELLFNLLAFGTAAAGEGVARDVNTSLPLVYATFGTESRFGRFWGTSPYAIFQQAHPLYGTFQAWIEQRHFQAILDAARQVDPLLSPRPEDYSVANFGLVNEAYGEGEIGVVVNEITLSVKGVD